MFFEFKGISSSDKGIVVLKLPTIEIAQREYEEIRVIGNDKTHIVEKSYLPTRKRIEVAYFGDKYDDLAKLLNGSGRLILSSMQDRYYIARIDNSIKFDSIVSNKLNTFVINFMCQPFSYLINDKPISCSVGTNVYINNGSVYSCPIVHINGNGSITISITGLNELGERREIVTRLEGVVGSITLDSEKLIAYNGKENYSNKVKGEYPILNVGENNIVITGDVTSVKITPNTRFLL